MIFLYSSIFLSSSMNLGDFEPAIATDLTSPRLELSELESSSKVLEIALLKSVAPSRSNWVW